MKKYLALMLIAVMAVTVVSSAGVVSAKVAANRPTVTVPVYLEPLDPQGDTEQHVGPVMLAKLQPLDNAPGNYLVTSLTLVPDHLRGLNVQDGQIFKLSIEFKTTEHGKPVYGPDITLAFAQKQGSNVILTNPSTLTIQANIVSALQTRQAVLEYTPVG